MKLKSVLVVLMGLFFTACGGSGSGGSKAPSADEIGTLEKVLKNDGMIAYRFVYDQNGCDMDVELATQSEDTALEEMCRFLSSPETAKSCASHAAKAQYQKLCVVATEEKPEVPVDVPVVETPKPEAPKPEAPKPVECKNAACRIKQAGIKITLDLVPGENVEKILSLIEPGLINANDFIKEIVIYNGFGQHYDYSEQKFYLANASLHSSGIFEVLRDVVSHSQQIGMELHMETYIPLVWSHCKKTLSTNLEKLKSSQEHFKTFVCSDLDNKYEVKNGALHIKYNASTADVQKVIDDAVKYSAAHKAFSNVRIMARGVSEDVVNRSLQLLAPYADRLVAAVNKLGFEYIKINDDYTCDSGFNYAGGNLVDRDAVVIYSIVPKCDIESIVSNLEEVASVLEGTRVQVVAGEKVLTRLISSEIDLLRKYKSEITERNSKLRKISFKRLSNKTYFESGVLSVSPRDLKSFESVLLNIPVNKN